MNDNQKDRLLKLAENNPDIAKDVVDILKQENQASNEPVEVKVVEQKREKIQITDDQKKYAKLTVMFGIMFVLCILLDLIIVMTSLFGFDSEPSLPIVGSIFILAFLSGILANVFQIKAGWNTVKVIFNRHFQL